MRAPRGMVMVTLAAGAVTLTGGDDRLPSAECAVRIAVPAEMPVRLNVPSAAEFVVRGITPVVVSTTASATGVPSGRTTRPLIAMPRSTTTTAVAERAVSI